MTQCVHALLLQFGFGAYFDQLSILALLLGAIVHDMGHGLSSEPRAAACAEVMTVERTIIT